jgi:hypothetical protein
MESIFDTGDASPPSSSGAQRALLQGPHRAVRGSWREGLPARAPRLSSSQLLRPPRVLLVRWLKHQHACSQGSDVCCVGERRARPCSRKQLPWDCCVLSSLTKCLSHRWPDSPVLPRVGLFVFRVCVHHDNRFTATAMPGGMYDFAAVSPPGSSVVLTFGGVDSATGRHRDGVDLYDRCVVRGLGCKGEAAGRTVVNYSLAQSIKAHLGKSQGVTWQVGGCTTEACRRLTADDAVDPCPVHYVLCLCPHAAARVAGCRAHLVRCCHVPAGASLLQHSTATGEDILCDSTGGHSITQHSATVGAHYGLPGFEGWRN